MISGNARSGGRAFEQRENGPNRRPYPSRSHEPHDGPLGRAFGPLENEPNRRSRGYPPDDYPRMRDFYPQDRGHNYYDRPFGSRYPSDYDFDPRDAGFHEPSYYYRDGYGDMYRERRRPEGYHVRPQSPSRARSPSIAPAGAPPETEATEP